MNAKTEAFRSKFFAAAFTYQKFCFMSRAKEFQIEACEGLESLKREASTLKREAVDLEDEDSANASLSFELMIEALTDELKMWIALKNDDPNSAWDYLVNAQVAAGDAMQIHAVARHLESYINHLYAIEPILFPPQMFCSPGMIIKKAKCSICGQEYGECTHVKGRAYMGELCVRHIVKADLREVSCVTDPANKQARATSFKEDGKTRDVMTWRIIPDESSL
jgi:hypothetical protein